MLERNDDENNGARWTETMVKIVDPVREIVAREHSEREGFEQQKWA